MARGYQRVLTQLIDLSKLHSFLVIESTGVELSSELDRYKRHFNVILVRVRAPLEVCLARAKLRDKAAGDEVSQSNQISQNLKVEWAMTFENLDPLPTRAQIREAFAPLFSSSSSFSASCSSTASSATSASATPTTIPAVVRATNAPVTLGSTKPPSKQTQGKSKTRSCLKQQTEEPRRGVRWDEPNLQQNEDEKVPRMKIDEPKTPFNYLDADDDDGGEPIAETENLVVAFVSGSDDDERMAPSQPPHRRRGSYAEEKGPGLAAVDVASLASEALRRREAEWEESEGSDDFMTYKERKLEQQRQADFEEKRKQHYNMGSLLKRQKSVDEGDED